MLVSGSGKWRIHRCQPKIDKWDENKGQLQLEQLEAIALCVSVEGSLQMRNNIFHFTNISDYHNIMNAY